MIKWQNSFWAAILMIVATGCVGSSFSQKDLTRIIVPRKTVQSADTILSRLGIELSQQDSVVENVSEDDLYIKDLTGEDSLLLSEQSLVADTQESKVEEKILQEVVEQLQPEKQVETQPQEKRGNYHVIVASFPNSELVEAEKYVERLKSSAPEAMLLQTESRVRIVYSSHATMALATEARDSLAVKRPKYKDSWVLKRTME